MCSVVAGCAASPDEPGDGELTAVVVSEQDQFLFGLGGGEADIYTDVVVLNRTILARIFQLEGRPSPLERPSARGRVVAGGAQSASRYRLAP